MLVLTRKLQERIQIGDNITITILRVKGQTVRVGIEAPRETKVVRGELPPLASQLPAQWQSEFEAAEHRETLSLELPPELEPQTETNIAADRRATRSRRPLAKFTGSSASRGSAFNSSAAALAK